MTGAAPTDQNAALAAAAALHQAGQFNEAERAYLALGDQTGPHRAQTLQLLGLLYRQTGQSLKALIVYDRLVALGAVSPNILIIRGDLLQGLGRQVEAVLSYDQALASDPGRADAHNNRGVALEALGRLSDALESFDASLQHRPDDANTHYNRAGVLAALHRPAEALEAYDRTLNLRPNHAQTLNNRALVLGALKRWDEALTSLDQALAIAPDYADALANRSIALRRLKRPADALASVDQALALRPDFPQALTTRGLALAALGRFEAALQSHEQALAGRPAYPEALNNAALALEGLGRFEEAADRLEAALALDPDFAEAEFNSGLALLRLGRFAAGWRRHEARFRRQGRPGPTYPPDCLWLGAVSPRGETLLLHAEQGLGDTIQFCRYVAAVRALGARIVLEVQPALVRLMAGLAGADQVIAIGDPVPAFDHHTPLMSLPLALGLGDDLGPAGPYLAADPGRTKIWRAALGAVSGRRIGLVWSGNPAHENDLNRSVPVQALAPLLTEVGAHDQIISLQKEVRAADQPWLTTLPQIIQVADRLDDFTDTAALVAACDLVICVDTAVAHLAGALGRPVWLLLPTPADWRWGATGEATPWYATMRLFRQDRPGDWASVVRRVAEALANQPGELTAA